MQLANSILNGRINGLNWGTHIPYICVYQDVIATGISGTYMVTSWLMYIATELVHFNSVIGTAIYAK